MGANRGALEDECRTAAEALQAGVDGRKVLVVAVMINQRGDYEQSMFTACADNPTAFEQTRLLAGLAAAAVEWVDVHDPLR